MKEIESELIFYETLLNDDSDREVMKNIKRLLRSFIKKIRLLERE